MSYYGKRGGYRGDYYRGDYYRGDIWDDITGALTSAGAQVGQGLIGQGIGALGSKLFGATPAAAILSTSPGSSLVPMPNGQLSPFKGGRPIQQMGPSAPAITMQPERGYRIPGIGIGAARRRMNVCNPRALRRALRRSAGFLKFAKHFVKLSHPHASVTMRQAPTKRHKR